MMRVSRFVSLVACVMLSIAPMSAGAQAGKKPPTKPETKPQAQPQWKKGGGKLDPKMSEAKRLFDEGATAYTEGNYEKAIESWEMSYEISKKDLICESLANAYERLGKPKQARDYLLRWRAVAPVDERDVLDSHLKNLEARIAREEEAEKQLQAEREKREKERKAPAVTPATSSGISIPGIVLAGVGVGAVVTGVVLDVLAVKSRPDEAAACRPVGDRQLCLATEKDAIESSNKQAFIGDVLWIAGSVAGAAGVVLLVTHGLSSKPKADATAFVAAPVVTPHGGGFAVRAQF